MCKFITKSIAFGHYQQNYVTICKPRVIMQLLWQSLVFSTRLKTPKKNYKKNPSNFVVGISNSNIIVSSLYKRILTIDVTPSKYVVPFIEAQVPHYRRSRFDFSDKSLINKIKYASRITRHLR